MKYLYVYKRGACNIEIREESEIKVHPGKFGIFKPIARIPVEDLQAEQKQEEIKEEVSNKRAVKFCGSTNGRCK